ncbi:unnamed protein product [Camellia sinensis]|uniref:late embryogenesis abundant protein Dc3-like n=1 Tax=Camellia sinensis TaxID=4442 RepID=UPI0010359A29|nr:late embryogenesis abundant protein Dc3-like [Camellia sinensis]
MANQGNRGLSYKTDETGGQAQMMHDDYIDQLHQSSSSQGINLQQTKESVVNMAQGAAHGAANMAKGAATEAANMAQGATTAVKNTLGMSNTDPNRHPSNPNRRI